jgi:uncharacterized coiled-coil protein SlyX
LEALIQTEQSLQAKTAFSRDRFDAAISKVRDAMKKLATIQDQLAHLTTRVTELKRLKAQLQAEASAEPPSPPLDPPA